MTWTDECLTQPGAARSGHPREHGAPKAVSPNENLSYIIVTTWTIQRESIYRNHGKSRLCRFDPTTRSRSPYVGKSRDA